MESQFLIVAELHTLNNLLATHFNKIDRPKGGWIDGSPYDKILKEMESSLAES